MKSTLANAPEPYLEYLWKNDGTDGLRSYSYNASNSNWNYSKQDGTNSNGAYTFTDSSTGKPSARRGNLYNFTAATLGSGLPLKANGQQAPDSICPRGWQLPLAKNSSSYAPDRSFAKFIKTYEVTNDVTGVNRVSEWPLEYLPTGNYSPSSGYVYARTWEGFWWSSVVNTSTTSGYKLEVTRRDVLAVSNIYRGYGHALRCVGNL